MAGVAKGLPKQTDRDEHYAALPYEDVPGFVQRLRASDNGEAVRLAFEFLVLTASRTSEVLEAKWSEFDLQQRVWTVPASRMKAGRTHRVPLVECTLEILERAKEVGGGSDYAFPSRNGTKPLSNMVFLMAIRRMKLDITAHGFRSSFRDWAAEQPTFHARFVRQPWPMRWRIRLRRPTDVVTYSRRGAS